MVAILDVNIKIIKLIYLQLFVFEKDLLSEEK